MVVVDIPLLSSPFPTPNPLPNPFPFHSSPEFQTSTFSLSLPLPIPPTLPLSLTSNPFYNDSPTPSPTPAHPYSTPASPLALPSLWLSAWVSTGPCNNTTAVVCSLDSPLNSQSLPDLLPKKLIHILILFRLFASLFVYAFPGNNFFQIHFIFLVLFSRGFSLMHFI